MHPFADSSLDIRVEEEVAMRHGVTIEKSAPKSYFEANESSDWTTYAIRTKSVNHASLFSEYCP